MQESLLTRDEMERRRLAAAQDLLNGFSQARVARKFGVSRTTASRWHRAVKAATSLDTLRKRRATGRPCRLTTEQKTAVIEMFAAGPRAAGFDTDRWTTTRLAEAIAARFGVRYDPDHVGRLMHRLGLRKRRDEVTIQEMPDFAELAIAEAPIAYAPNYGPGTPAGFTLAVIPTTVQ